MHGNSLDSTKPHLVYEIYDSQATTPGKVHKSGVSGQPSNSNGSPRLNRQLNKLNAANPVPPGQAPRYTGAVVGENLPNLRTALALEQYLVNVHANTVGQPGKGNLKPVPNQMLGPGARGK